MQIVLLDDSNEMPSFLKKLSSTSGFEKIAFADIETLSIKSETLFLVNADRPKDAQPPLLEVLKTLKIRGEKIKILGVYLINCDPGPAKNFYQKFGANEIYNDQETPAAIELIFKKFIGNETIIENMSVLQKEQDKAPIQSPPTQKPASSIETKELEIDIGLVRKYGMKYIGVKANLIVDFAKDQKMKGIDAAKRMAAEIKAPAKVQKFWQELGIEKQ